MKKHQAKSSLTTTLAALVLGMALLATGGACSEDTTSGPTTTEPPVDTTAGPIFCSKHVECDPYFMACINGICAQDCTADWHCDPDEKCEHYQCVNASITDTVQPGTDTAYDLVDLPDGQAPVSCTKDWECDHLDMACIDGVCGRDCVTDAHCGPGMYCFNYKCYQTGQDAVTTDTVTPPVDTVGPDTSEDTGEPWCVSDDPSCIVQKGKYGDTCNCKCGCETQLCVQNKSTGGATCTKYCSTASDCPGIDGCLDISMPNEPETKICYFNDSGTDCSTGCSFGLSLTNAKGACQCAMPCDDASRCPENMGCMFFSGVSQKVCVEVFEVIDNEGYMLDCDTVNPAYNPCFGVCQGVSGTAGFCTTFCDSGADCPDGMYCGIVSGTDKVCIVEQ